MNRIARISTLSLAAIAGAAALLCSSSSALAAGSIKAAYVEQVIPSRTWYGSMSVLNSINSMGPGTGILGITSITLTNFDSSAQQVFIFAPIYAGGGLCGSPIIGGSDPRMQVYVQPNSTLHLTYPTPLVMNPISGNTCIAAEVTTQLHAGSVEIDVNGVIN
jgi:hypothetical protein